MRTRMNCQNTTGTGIVGIVGIVGRVGRVGKKKRAGAFMPSALCPLPCWFSLLREYSNDHPAVLRAAFTRSVRLWADRLFLTPADDVHLVQRHLMRLVQIALHGFRTRLTDT